MNRRHVLTGGGALVLAGAGATYFGLRQMGSMEEYNASVAATRAALSERPEMQDFIRYATLAANGHNTQPWRFRIGEGRIEILPDFSRRTPVVDPDDHHLFVSLGCAAENLALAAGARGRPGELSFNPANDGSVVFAFGGGPTAGSALFDAIPRRQSTRADYDGRPVSAADLQTLAAAAAIPGVDLVLITDRPQIDRVRDLVVAGNSAQMADAAFVRELKSWLRFSPRQAIETGDGLFSASSGNPTLPAWLGPRVFDWVFNADAENDKYARQLRRPPASRSSFPQQRRPGSLGAGGARVPALRAAGDGARPEARLRQSAGRSRKPAAGACGPCRHARASSRHRHAVRLRARASVLGAPASGSGTGVEGGAIRA